jgi:hypothetical protein
MNLLAEYGKVVIPKNFKLYHASTNGIDLTKTAEHDYVLFCCIDFAYNPSGTLYEIKLLKDYELLFCVSKIHITSMVGAFVDICKRAQLPVGKVSNSLCVKQSNENRHIFIEYLRSCNIYGWFSSIEDNPVPEICLFTKNWDDMFEIRKIPIDSNLENSCDILIPRLKLGTLNDKLSSWTTRALQKNLSDYFKDKSNVSFVTIFAYVLYLNNIINFKFEEVYSNEESDAKDI